MITLISDVQQCVSSDVCCFKGGIVELGDSKFLDTTARSHTCHSLSLLLTLLNDKHETYLSIYSIDSCVAVNGWCLLHDA
ncbi:hypothetical protein EB796_017900 [Bugula neritina]|uniref:Uncharacterized protein n=1 Tax=Bugula neritina TaxID=10212 RepID=A0A7J7JEJ5_BUGNE|nr:hypothetical protein EB796_017900 [Bugula neritina]